MSEATEMTTAEYVNEVKSKLLGLGDKSRALKMSAYLKDQFTFLGIATLLRRDALKPLNDSDFSESQLFEIAEALWLLPEREYRYAAIDLLDQKSKVINTALIPRLLKLVQREPWWETVDSLSGVIGDVIARVRKNDMMAQSMMDEAITHSSLWVRRVALTHQLGWRLKTDEERLFRYAITVSEEKEFFIRKAIGWALRDYARWNPEAVRNFILINQHHFSSLTIRETTKYMAI
jgi:3-methyladenine DNA glycosylase AlkD